MKVLILKESGRAGHIYYHFTNVNGVIGILKDNKIKSRRQTEHIMRGKDTVSFSRDKDFGKKFNNVSLCRIAIDIEKIAQRYKITPYEWNNYAYSSDTARSTQESESEESVLGDIENIKDYILSIDIVDTVYYNDDSVIVKKESSEYNPITPRKSFTNTLKSGKVIGIENNLQIKHNIKSYEKFLDFIRTNGIPLGTFSISSDTYSKNPYKRKYSIDSDNSNVKDYKVFIVGTDYDADVYYLVPTLSDKQAIKKFNNVLKTGSAKIVSIFRSNIENYLDLKSIDSNNSYIDSFYQLIRNNPNKMKNKFLNAKFKIILNNKVQELKDLISLNKEDKTITIRAK